MARNLRNVFHRPQLTEQDIRTLRGAITTLVQGRRARRPKVKPGLSPLPQEEAELRAEGEERVRDAALAVQGRRQPPSPGSLREPDLSPAGE